MASLQYQKWKKKSKQSIGFDLQLIIHLNLMKKSTINKIIKKLGHCPLASLQSLDDKRLPSWVTSEIYALSCTKFMWQINIWVDFINICIAVQLMIPAFLFSKLGHCPTTLHYYTFKSKALVKKVSIDEE